jgi:hypothetical protein
LLDRTGDGCELVRLGGFERAQGLLPGRRIVAEGASEGGIQLFDLRVEGLFLASDLAQILLCLLFRSRTAVVKLAL